MKVLLVDDDADLRMIGRLSLTTLARWSVIEAGSGEAAIELATRHRPDLILLDVMMPRLDGAATFARLRADTRTATIPVIFITAKAQTLDLEGYLALGAQGVITKPFDPMTLPSLIVQLLENKVVPHAP